MKKALFLLVLSTLVFFLFQVSCEKRTVTPGETDWDAVKAIISENPHVFALGFFDTQPDTLFYREITESNADIEEGWLTEADDTLHFYDRIDLTWSDSLRGTFHYRLNGKPHKKSIYSVALTNAYFERRMYTSAHRGWVLWRFSGTVIKSVGTTRYLDELHIESDGVDVYVYESTQMNRVKKDSILTFGKEKQVTFTIDASDTSDFFFLHVNEGEVHQKIPFLSTGDGFFSASWTTIPNPDPAKSYYNAIVDVVSNESVTDTTAEYDSKAWGIIYKIK